MKEGRYILVPPSQCFMVQALRQAQDTLVVVSSLFQIHLCSVYADAISSQGTTSVPDRLCQAMEWAGEGSLLQAALCGIEVLIVILTRMMCHCGSYNSPGKATLTLPFATGSSQTNACPLFQTTFHIIVRALLARVAPMVIFVSL